LTVCNSPLKTASNLLVPRYLYRVICLISLCIEGAFFAAMIIVLIREKLGANVRAARCRKAISGVVSIPGKVGEVFSSASELVLRCGGAVKLFNGG
jgi:hypothetical protein